MTMRFGAAGWIGLLLLASSLCGQVSVPNRSGNPLYKGTQGKQRTEVQYDPATGNVTLKIAVQDPNGYFIPNIRRENFAVYEDGVRIGNAEVSVEHAPVTIGLLAEYGGRYPALNRDLAGDVSRAGDQLLKALGEQDKMAIWLYADSVKQATDFTQDHGALESLLLGLKPPEVSETNLYDAVIFAIDHMRPVTGRKAAIVISSGIDTFSKASHEAAVAAARRSDAPIYAISLAQILRDAAQLHGEAHPAIDWKAGENRLHEIAQACGGRLYSPASSIDLSPIYDDLMENLKVRYVITYTSPKHDAAGVARTVRVELVDPKAGKPLQIVDANGRPVRVAAIAEASYSPEARTQK